MIPTVWNRYEASLGLARGCSNSTWLVALYLVLSREGVKKERPSAVGGLLNLGTRQIRLIATPTCMHKNYCFNFPAAASLLRTNDP